jgi:hypothetical protein
MYFPIEARLKGSDYSGLHTLKDFSLLISCLIDRLYLKPLKRPTDI